MTQFLPPNLLALFAPRDPVPYLPPVAKLPHEKKNRGYLGVGAFLDQFEVLFNCLHFFLVDKKKLILELFRIPKILHLLQELKPEKKD